MNRYSLRKDPKYNTLWIALPNNGGEVGDMSDITCELNRLLGNYEVAIDERDTAIAERDEWKAKFIQQNKDLGCEMMDPNGTIWDYAKKLQKDLDAAIAERDEARSRFNEIDLCKNGQAPCKWSLKLIHERDEARQHRKELAEALDVTLNATVLNHRNDR